MASDDNPKNLSRRHSVAPHVFRASQRRQRLPVLRTILLILALSTLASYFWTVWVVRYLGLELADKQLLDARSILWVTAHPDDESFFFAPTITSLLSQDSSPTGHLLCLSIGNYEGMGKERREELVDSCQALGIERRHCTSLDLPELQDGPDSEWPSAVIESSVRDYVARHNIDAIVTFDDYGVSGHSNHRSVGEAIKAASKPFPRVYAVLSTNILAKYSSLFSLPFTLSMRWATSPSTHPATSLFVSSPKQYWQGRDSFAQHKSQEQWFRTLFINFSRYLWYVEVQEVIPK